MLQQTQAERIRVAYPAFLERFPDLRTLAAATSGDVIRAWSGLGYNRRAVMLHAAARAVMERFDGAVPADPQALRSLPGVGPYTAAAVANLALGRPEAVVDTNVRRVLARLVLGVEPRDAPEPAIRRAAEALLPRGRAGDWNQALMDLGREVCRSVPRCSECPVAPSCRYRRSGRAPTRAPNGRSQAPFRGSARQARGGILALLRERGATTLATAARAAGVPLDAAARLVEGLVRDGLLTAGPAALAGRPGGRIRLPS